MPTNANDKLLFGSLSFCINGILFNVHNELGRFAKEKQYDDLLETKFQEERLSLKKRLSWEIVEI